MLCMLEMSCKLPYGNTIVIDNERFRCPPNMYVIDMAGIADSTYQSIMPCDFDIHKK